MVLLNGIKYACERCIRGHRVSSCTHTDKPLTMIKRKGRPASQCDHCREQRKAKNVHTQCDCSKRGKSPGQHFASCLCHKNSHCTCVSKDKKAAVKKKPEPSTPDPHVQPRATLPPHAKLQLNSPDFLIEDISLPFGTENGLLDYLSSLNLASGVESMSNDAESERQTEFYSSQQDLNPVISEGDLGELTEFPGMGLLGAFQANRREADKYNQPPSDTELDLMENMFPLFPLVGYTSFEDDKSLPLLGVPTERTSHTANNDGERKVNLEGSSTHPSRSQSVLSHMNEHFTHLNYEGTPTSSTNVSSEHAFHPRPTRASASASSTSILHSKPRRPDSVLSLASTSSNTSKQATETPLLSQYPFPKTASSAAFPPFNLMESTSHDDLNNLFIDSSGLLSDGHITQNFSDDEIRIQPGTPLSSLPSRKALQIRRKSSLSRSQSQSQSYQSIIPKENSFTQARVASSVDASPNNTSTRRSPPAELVSKIHIESNLQGVAEETALEEEIQDTVMETDQTALNNIHRTLFEGADSSLFPMYQEIFHPTGTGI